MGRQRAGTLDALARYDAMVAEGHVMSKSLQTMAENLRNQSYAKNAKKVFKSNQLDEYVAAVNRFLDRGGTTKDIIKLVGVLQSEDGTDMLKLARRGGKKTDKNPFGLTLRGMREGTNTNLNRKLNEEVPLKYRSHFKNDADWERYKEYIRKGNISNEKLTPKGFHKGHTTSISIVEASHDPFAQRLESATGNMSTGAKHDIPRERLQAAGTPTTWEESIDQFKNPRKYKKFQILTPQDRQRIYRGENPDDVFLQRKVAITANPKASGAHANLRTRQRHKHPGRNLKINQRVRKLKLPIIGTGLTALTMVGGDLLRGDVQAAGQTIRDNWLDFTPAGAFLSNLDSDQRMGHGTFTTLYDGTQIQTDLYNQILDRQRQQESNEAAKAYTAGNMPQNRMTLQSVQEQKQRVLDAREALNFEIK